jgi:hypothetical protein
MSMKVERSGDPFDLETFLARPLIAHLATASADGPRESPAWFYGKKVLSGLLARPVIASQSGLGSNLGALSALSSLRLTGEFYCMLGCEEQQRSCH